MSTLVVLALACVVFPASIAAAEPPPAPEWEVEIAPYLWLALAHGQANTPVGRQEFTVTASDVFDTLDLGAMGAVKLRWKRWVALLDVVWAKLSDDDGIGDTRVRFDLTQKLGWFEALAGYRVYEKPGGLFGTPSAVDRRIFAFDAMAGLTYAWVDLRLKLSRDPGMILPPASRTAERDNDWVAPYLGFRFTNDFSERFGNETLLGVGAFGVGDAPNVSWQATSQLYYRASEAVSLWAGYRALGFRDTNLRTTFHGPVLGVSFRFAGGR